MRTAAKLRTTILILLLLAAGAFLAGRNHLVRIAPELSALSRCEQEQGDFNEYEQSKRYLCYVEAIRASTKSKGVARTVQEFGAYMRSDTGKALDGAACHVIAHYIGEAAVEAGYRNSEILTGCKNFCTGGCMNGAAHGYIIDTGDVKVSEEFCNSAPVTPDVRYACYHGIGHGLTEVMKFDVPRGLAMCDRLKEERGKTECAHAVLMNFEPLFAAKSVNVPSDMLGFCRAGNPLYKSECYEFAGSLSYAKSKDFFAALTLCSRVPEEVRGRCGDHVMDIFVHTTPRPDRLAAITRQCSQGSAAFQRLCFIGAAKAGVFTIGGVTGEESIAICNIAPVGMRQDCYIDSAKIEYSQYGATKKQEYCQNVPETYRAACDVLLVEGDPAPGASDN